MIDGIYDNNLCNFCGTCFSACPQDAISFIKNRKNFKFLSDPSKCIKCGTCLRVCPGIGVDFKKLNNFVFQKFPQNKLLGIFKSCYIASSRNKKIRYEASSGGVISSFLVFLLKEKLIDGALVASMNEKNPLEPRVFIARTKNEILSAKGSKYLPVPLNIGIKKITEAKRNERFAVVGLPCHIQGVRKMQMVNPQLKEKISICLGLFCGKTVNFTGTKFLLKYWDVKESDVKTIAYRGKGWPGQMIVKTREGNDVLCKYFDFFNFFNLGFFIPGRCFLCIDNTNELSDISFGDAWLPDIMSKDKIGSNIVVTRTRKGEALFKQAQDFITYNEIDSKKIIKSMYGFFSKKQSYYFISKFARIFGFSTPKYDIKYGKKINLLSFSVLVFFINSLISNKFHGLFIKIPKSLWKTYLKILHSSYCFSRIRKRR